MNVIGAYSRPSRICNVQRWIVALLVVSGVVYEEGSAESLKSWPTFRGADRTAVAPDTGLLKQWPEGGPQLVWRGKGAGRGYASLAIADGRIYTLGDTPSTADDDSEYLVCFSDDDGKQLWKTKTGSPWTSGQADWQSSRSTPTVDRDRVYVLTAFGELVCSTNQGEVVWRKHLKDELKGEKADNWGYSESVLIDGDRLVCTPGGAENTMVALDKRSGESLWSCQREGDRGAGHSSIVITHVGRTKVYVTNTGSGPMGVRAADGKLMWTNDVEETTAVIPTPLVRDDLVFVSIGYKRGGMLLRQIAGADNTVSIKPLYELNPKLANKHGGVVLVGDHVFGDSDDAGIPFCADLMTGDIRWQSRGSGKKSASIVAADGHLYIRYADGTMTLVKASADEFTEVSSFKIPGSGERPSWAHPVILNGKLYLREGDDILCYQLRN